MKIPLAVAAVTLALSACESTTTTTISTPAATGTAAIAPAPMNVGTAAKGASTTAELDKHPDVKAIRVKITKKGFEPPFIAVKKGVPFAVEFTRVEEKTCATEAIFDDLGLRADLPLNTPVRVSFTPEKAGDLVYGCAMGKMVSARIHVSE